MGDMEKTVDDVTTDVDNEELDTTDDSGDVQDERVALFKKYKIDPETASQDDLYNVLQRLTKAEQLKREAKSKKAESLEPKGIDDEELDKRLEKREFLKANQELAEYKDEFESKIKLGLSLEEAKLLVMNSDKAKQNREKLSSLGLSDGESISKKSSYTQEEVAKLPPEKAREIWDMARKGKITVR